MGNRRGPTQVPHSHSKIIRRTRKRFPKPPLLFRLSCRKARTVSESFSWTNWRKGFPNKIQTCNAVSVPMRPRTQECDVGTPYFQDPHATWASPVSQDVLRTPKYLQLPKIRRPLWPSACQSKQRLPSPETSEASPLPLPFAINFRGIPRIPP